MATVLALGIGATEVPKQKPSAEVDGAITAAAHVHDTAPALESSENVLASHMVGLQLTSEIRAADIVELMDSQTGEQSPDDNKVVAQANVIALQDLSEARQSVQRETTGLSSVEDSSKDPEKTSPISPCVDPTKIYSPKEVSAHNTPNDMWLVIDNEIFNVTEFRNEHPGGAKIINGVAGKDATKKFDKYHRRGLLERYRPKLRIGVLDNEQVAAGTRRGLLWKLGVGKKQS